MRKVIKQIGFEGRTTIPQNLRQAMGIRDGDFISFEMDPDGKSIRVMKEQICPHGATIPNRPDIVVTGFVPKLDEKELQKVLFVLEHILGFGGGSK